MSSGAFVFAAPCWAAASSEKSPMMTSSSTVGESQMRSRTNYTTKINQITYADPRGLTQLYQRENYDKSPVKKPKICKFRSFKEQASE